MSSSTSSPNLPPLTPWPPETSTWKTYPLHCHCGSIRYNIKISPPLLPSDDRKNEGIYTVGECKCSYCERNGYLSVHPRQENVEFTQGDDKITKYWFGRKECPHWFCKDCGSVLATDLSKLCEGMGIEKRYTINVRMLKDFDPKRLKIQKMEFMKDQPPKYEID